ncbi:MAG TPA: cytochrome c oxidase subunit II [Thermoleophilaceae bacterium]|nr:cytochrome c oxidase subunit II [Thermoleophilaceae bacterium]
MAETPRSDENGHEGHPFAQMISIGVVAAIIVTTITLLMDWFPTNAAGAASKIDTLYDVLLIASVPIFVLVMTVAVYSVWRFRARPGDTRDGAPIHGNTRLEIIWVTVPFMLVTGLAIYGWVVLNDIEAKQPNELQVKVTGQQFTWSFEYPKEKVKSSQLMLPVDRPVHFRINTKDVVHSFWVPQFRLKSDAVPGITTRIRVTPDKVGTFEVVCAELCGIGHATMRNRVRVLPRRQFDAWLARQKGGPAGGGGGGGAPGGKAIFTANGCDSCHTLADAGATGNVGPKLDDLATAAAKFGKARRESAKEYVRESIVDPRAFTVPGYPKNVMPTTFGKDLSKEQIDALVDYLLRVSGGKGS